MCEGNLALCVGVRGEESWTLDGDDPSSRASALFELLLVDSDLLMECRDEVDRTDPDERSFSCDLCSRDFTYVAWLDEADFLLILDLSSLRDPDLETPETADFVVSSPLFLLSAETSVSGGVGGLEPFFDVDDFLGSSADFDLRSSSPKSVGSGVRGFDFRRSVTSSRLMTASLLWALLKVGYGIDIRCLSSDILDMSAATSLVEPFLSLGSSWSLSRSLSLSLLRWRLVEASLPSTPSLLRDVDDLEDR